MLPSLQRAAGAEKVLPVELSMPSEDFAYYAQRIPGLFVFLGVTPEGQDLRTVARNHSPHFFADEAALPVGVRTLTHLTLDYLAGAKPTQ